jgi:hypothetical protein
MTDEEKTIERVAYASWKATGHRATDWAYMAPEIPRKQRYLSYAKAAIEAFKEES